MFNYTALICLFLFSSTANAELIPHNLIEPYNKADVGLPNVDNTSDANKPISTATQTALDLKVPTSRTINGNSLGSNVTLTKSDIGLSNADNTSDLNKPISTATQTALNGKETLGAAAAAQAFSIQRANHTGSQLSSTISDFDSQVAATACIKTNNLSDLLSASTARSNLGLGNVSNTSDANKPVSTAQQAALDLKLETSQLVQTIVNGATNSIPSSDAVYDFVTSIPSSAVWGSISGTLSNQTDLQTALNGKETSGAAATAQAFSIQRSNHTGTQLSSTISDFVSAVSSAIGFTPENVANKSNGALSASTTTYPTSGAVKTYADTGLATKEPTITTLPVSKGGTGAGALTANRFLFTGASGVYGISSNAQSDVATNRFGLGGAVVANTHLSLTPTSGHLGLLNTRANASTADFSNFKDVAGKTYFKVDKIGRLCVGDYSAFGSCDYWGGSGGTVIGAFFDQDQNSDFTLVNGNSGTGASTSASIISDAGMVQLYAFGSNFDKGSLGLEGTFQNKSGIVYGDYLAIEASSANITNVLFHPDYLGTVNFGANQSVVSTAEAQIKIEPTFYNNLNSKVTIHHKGGGFMLDTNVSQPACTVTNRGQFWIIQGGLGVADTLQVCEKTSSNTYAWATKSSGGAGAVSSVFGRTGVVTAQSGDYDTSQVSEVTNLYHTPARVIASPITGFVSGAGSLSSTDTILQAINKLDGNVSGKQAALGFTPVANTVTVNGFALSSNVTLAKGDVGLGNVDNTSDLSKPISTATQTALNLKANTSSLATVATSGLYSDLSGAPTNVSSFTNDSGYVTQSGVRSTPLTGYVSGAGTISATDTVLQAIQKLNGNDAAKQPAGSYAVTTNNLSDLSSASTARTNLGLGTAATQSTGTFAQVANNLSDLSSASTARTNLGLGTAATQSSGTFLQAANNLSDLSNASTARTNLGIQGETSTTCSTSTSLSFATTPANKVTLSTAGCTLTFTGMTTGGAYAVRLVQDATGSRTVTWPAGTKWPGGTVPTLTTTANAIDVVSVYYDGTNYYASAGLNYQ